jgi:hypothetical protein
MRCISSFIRTAPPPTLSGFYQFQSQLMRHRLGAMVTEEVGDFPSVSLPRGVDNPAQRQTDATGGADFNGHLVSRPSHAAGARFYQRDAVFDGFRQHL